MIWSESYHGEWYVVMEIHGCHDDDREWQWAVERMSNGRWRVHKWMDPHMGNMLPANWTG